MILLYELCMPVYCTSDLFAINDCLKHEFLNPAEHMSVDEHSCTDT